MEASMSGIPNPRVSVAVPVYNSAATLERCLRSATGQTLRNIEILVADDGSTDDSAAVAERLAAGDPRIRVFRLVPNGGKPAAMNRLVREARGDWVAVLDADDAYHAERLERLVAAAEAQGTDMAADNLVYVDGGADQVVQTAFDPGRPSRVVSKGDLLRHSDSYAEFDFGILKPMVRRSFVQAHGLAYYEGTRLAEDFYYLLEFFLSGGRCVLTGEPYYYWTMPFGAISRRWTTTGSGAWRYDYRQALAANEHFLGKARAHGDSEVAAMLEARSRQYRAMIHYLDAQRALAEGAWHRCAATVLGHPGIWGLLARRVAGRMLRRLPGRPAAAPAMSARPHPSLAPGLSTAPEKVPAA